MASRSLTLDQYRALPYTRSIERVTDEDGTYYVARITELPGLMADGVTRSEAILNLTQAFDDYIEAHLGWEDEIPLPEGADRLLRALGQPQAPVYVRYSIYADESPPRVFSEIAGDVTRHSRDVFERVPA